MKYSAYAIAASTCLADHSGEKGECYPGEIRGQTADTFGIPGLIPCNSAAERRHLKID